MTFLPNYSLIEGEGARPSFTVMILHGILGSGRNWRSFARSMVEHMPDCRFLLVDLRGHGESHGAPPPHTLDSCAEDLHELSESLGIVPQAVWAHSFGGKVALRYAQNHGGGLAQVWVLDTPFYATKAIRSPRQWRVGQLLNLLERTPMPVPARDDAIAPLREAGFPESVCLWMNTNLVRADDGFRWRFDLEVVRPLFQDYHGTDIWPAVLNRTSSTAIHLVYGGRSDRWLGSELERAREAQNQGLLKVHALQQAGHWLHVDDPEGLRTLLAASLQQPTG